MQEWLSASASDLGRGIGRGDINPVDLTQVYLQAIADHPLTDRIYARTTADRAISEASAAAARAKAGQRLSLLDGVPISWKDLFDTAGVATEAGSPLLKDRTPNRDAWVLRNATAMGLVCLGKTHMSELAFSGLGYNPMTATPSSVNDPEGVSGGSSSGAAASVAFGLAACGIGSDTGGSVRVPSVWNDLVGLKTTSGRVPLDGVVPLCAKFDTIGPLARTVEDAAQMLALMEGQKPADLNGVSLKGVRLGELQTCVMADLSDAPRAAYEAAIEQLKSAGAEIVKFDAPEVDAAQADAGVLYTCEAYGTWREAIEANPDKIFDQIRVRFEQGAKFSGPDYVAAWHRLDGYRKTWAARVAGFDAVICPTSPNLPANLERLKTDPDYYVSENLKTLRNTRVGNLMGVCALTLPTGVPSCGIMLHGAAFAEERLLRLGKACEIALG